MTNKVWVLGGGGHAKVVIATLESDGKKRSVEIFDENDQLKGHNLLGAEIVGATPDKSWWASEERNAIIAIGVNAVRERLSDLPANWVVAQHSQAFVHSSVQVGEGTLICAGAVVQPDTSIGKHAIINTSCSVDHDCHVEDYAHIGPGAHLAGNVTVGKRSFVGAGATIVPGVHIGADVTVGAGAVVLRDVADGRTVVGVPANEVE